LPVTLVVLVTKKLAVGPDGAVGVSLSQVRAMRARKSGREERVVDVLLRLGKSRGSAHAPSCALRLNRDPPHPEPRIPS
jgi:hypothetical protein